MSMNDLLLEAIRNRGEKLTEFNGGILTADRYVKTLQDCVGSDLCYRYAATRTVSFDDTLRKATKTLTYNNPEMLVEKKLADYALTDADGDSLELPKNTLMVFKHTLTTSRKDRDGDILRTQGARPDPKMLLLWQHVHTLPIGKMLAIAEHSSKTLTVVSAIIDMNDLAHDAAVMIDNGMGRFSHGFRALEFSDIKGEGDKANSPGGFDVKEFEIMEESLVSVPANVDAETDEVILSLVEGGKMTSRLMKAHGETLREHRNKQTPVGIDLKITVNGKDMSNENEPRSGSGTTKGEGKGCGCGSNASEKADGGDHKEEEISADDKKVKCPKCGKMMDAGSGGECRCGYKMGEDKGHIGDESEAGEQCPQCGRAKLDTSGTCQDCGYIRESGKSLDEILSGMFTEYGAKMLDATDKLFEENNVHSTKAGRVLSTKNYKAIQEVRDDLKGEVHENISTRSGKALCDKCASRLTEVVKSAGYEGDDEEIGKSFDENTAKEAMVSFLEKATDSEVDRMWNSLKAIKTQRERKTRTETYRSIFG